MTTPEKQSLATMRDAARLGRIADLVNAIDACQSQDAELVLAVFLEELRGDGPMPELLELEREAEFWAGMASFEQLRAYFIAAGSRLVHYPLGRNGRMRMVRAMLDGMPESERRAAVAELVTSEGNHQAG